MVVSRSNVSLGPAGVVAVGKGWGTTCCWHKRQGFQAHPRVPARGPLAPAPTQCTSRSDRQRTRDILRWTTALFGRPRPFLPRAPCVRFQHSTRAATSQR